ncbi:MAG: hypothetical protein DMD66_01815 [Gemmatimonadetes bacterium]|nr:MAG: hypothetical protein DMD66_01815 [Gemmatimonadota bacterium]
MAIVRPCVVSRARQCDADCRRGTRARDCRAGATGATSAAARGGGAAMCGGHPDYFARAFRTWFGAAVGAYVRRLRLDWAADRLARTEVPIVEIALDAGFADQSHFTRAFRHQVGVTPGDYRRTIRQ